MRKRFKCINLFSVLLLAVTFAGCRSGIFDNGETETDIDPPLKILFIGSSYFNYNNLPILFNNLAGADDKKADITNRSVNGLYLADHAESYYTEAIINKKKWDYVILQGVCTNAAYPDTHQDIFPPYKRHPLKESVETLKNKILANCDSTKIMYCMPWAFEDGTTWVQGQNDTYEDMQKKIYTNIIGLARELDLLIAPAGWAWYQILKDQCPVHYLHLPDWNHPSLRGSYLTACVIYASIFRERLEDNSYCAGLPVDEALKFQRTASETVVDSLEKWNL